MSSEVEKEYWATLVSTLASGNVLFEVIDSGCHHPRYSLPNGFSKLQDGEIIPNLYYWHWTGSNRAYLERNAKDAGQKYNSKTQPNYYIKRDSAERVV